MEEAEVSNIKQVIVMRHDLKMRKGKQIAQGDRVDGFSHAPTAEPNIYFMDDFSPNEQTWILGSFAKVCVRCNSEEELMAILDKAIDLGLEVHLITDSGRTEFTASQLAPVWLLVLMKPRRLIKLPATSNCCKSDF